MSPAEVFLTYFKPNPARHGRFIGIDSNGKKAADTRDGEPVTRALVEKHLQGDSRFVAIGYLPGDDTGTHSGMIDLDKDKYPEPGDLDDARQRIVEVAEGWGWKVCLETSTRGGEHIYVFTDKDVSHKAMKRALKALAESAGVSHYETYPAGDDHTSTWHIMPYAGAAKCDKRLGGTFLSTTDGEAVPYDELDEWLELTPYGLLLEKAADYDDSTSATVTSEPADLAPEALEALKTAAEHPPAVFARHESLVAFLNLGERCGRRQEMAEHLKSGAVFSAWIKDGSRDSKDWSDEVNRWIKAKTTKNKRGIAYLLGQGFVIPDLPKNKNEGATTANGTKEAKRTPNLIRMDGVQAENVSWLWYPYIPLGKATNLEGDPGLGKSFIALTLCALVTKGLPFPSVNLEDSLRTPNNLPPSNVIYMTAEDGLADTLKPRLEGAGADCTRVFALQTYKSQQKNGDEKDHAFSLQDIDVLEEALQETQAKLIVIDPIQGYLGRDVDMNQANDVRPILSAVGQLAEKYRCAIISIRHLAKSARSPLHKGLGSVDFTAFARSQLVVGKHEEQTVITHAKSSLAPAGRSIAYELKDGRLHWRGASDSTPDDVANPIPKNGQRDGEGEAEKLELENEILKKAATYFAKNQK